MKKLSNFVSPFILMLVPVFLVIAVLFTVNDSEIPANKYQASHSFRMPALTVSTLKIMNAVF
jgi:hypothetical protein